jgi:phosphate transport system protein
MNDHIVSAFDADIAGLRSAIMAMGGLAETQVARAVRSVSQASLFLVSQVLESEQTVNQLHVQVDLLCNQILVKRQPFAVDLREVIAVIHSINDLERVGDEAKKIALKARGMDGAQLGEQFPIGQVVQMGEKVCAMLNLALDAFIRHDPLAAPALAAQDLEVDALRTRLLALLVERMAEDPKQVSTALDLIFVVQSLERVGDHAKNLAEYVVNIVEGRDLRHRSAPL